MIDNTPGAAAGSRTTAWTAARAIVAAVAVLATIAAVAAPALGAQALTRYDDPDLRVTVGGTNVVTPGETTSLDLQLQNSGGTVGEFDGDPSLRGPTTASTPGAATATAVEVRAGDAPIDLRSGEQAAGTIPPDGMAGVPLTLEVDEDAAPGTYELPVSVTYDYLHLTLVDPHAKESTYDSIRNTATVTTTVTIRVESHVDPDVATTGSDLAVGSEGNVTVAVTNDGRETASDAALVLQDEGAVAASDPSAYVGDLAPGDTARASYRVAVDGDASAGSQPLTFALAYDDENGVRRTSAPATASAAVDDRADVAVDIEPLDLYVDSVGGVEVTVTNTGEDTLDAAKLVMRESPPFVPVASQTGVGDLAPGESATTSYRVEVSDRAVAGDYPLDFVVRYRNAYDDPEETSAVTAVVPVGPERSVDVVGEPPRLAAGGTETVTVTLRNTGNATLDSAVARINADTPLSTADDTAYLGALAPGETANASFRVSADGAAPPKTYAMDAEVKFRNRFGDRVVTDLVDAPVRVTEGGGLIAGLLSAVASVLP